MKQVAELAAKLGQNSGNSHLPPSSDSPDERRRRNEKKKSEGKRTRGGQQGTRWRASRDVAAGARSASSSISIRRSAKTAGSRYRRFPTRRRSATSRPRFPPVEPYTTEWRRHAVTCPLCGATRPALPTTVEEPIPASPPVRSAIDGHHGVGHRRVYHLSRRKAVGLLSDILGVRVSLGALSAVEARVSDAVQPAVDAAWERVAEAEVKHTGRHELVSRPLPYDGVVDGRYDGGHRVQDRGRQRQRYAQAAVRRATRGILVSESRQGAQLLGDGAAPDLLGASSSKVRLVLRSATALPVRSGKSCSTTQGSFFDYWHDCKAGKRLSREKFIAWMVPVRQQIETVLARAVAADIASLSGSCADILEHRGGDVDLRRYRRRRTDE